MACCRLWSTEHRRGVASQRSPPIARHAVTWARTRTWNHAGGLALLPRQTHRLALLHRSSPACRACHPPAFCGAASRTTRTISTRGPPCASNRRPLAELSMHNIGASDAHVDRHLNIASPQHRPGRPVIFGAYTPRACGWVCLHLVDPCAGREWMYLRISCNSRRGKYDAGLGCGALMHSSGV
jgi:hypothetical protein